MVNKQDFEKYIKVFLEENSKINLISKNDEKYLWEKHICDSLSIENFFNKYKIMPQKLLDIGTGGGFPAVPIAIKFPKISVYAIDSIAKKVNSIHNVKEKLKIENLHPICSRVENLTEKYDVVTCRAVSSLKNICQYALPKLKKDGYFVAYKSKKLNEEIEEAKDILKNYNAKIADIIEYTLPIEEKLTRYLVVIKFFN